MWRESRRDARVDIGLHWGPRSYPWFWRPRITSGENWCLRWGYLYVKVGPYVSLGM